MKLIKNCPICNDKFNFLYNGEYSPFSNKKCNFVVRYCGGINHIIQIYSNEDSCEIENMLISLEDDYSCFIDINFVNNCSKISYINSKEKESNKIFVPKLLTPDFPDLEKLREKVKKYIILD
jgi:hypothetical protein